MTELECQYLPTISNWTTRIMFFRALLPKASAIMYVPATYSYESGMHQGELHNLLAQ